AFGPCSLDLICVVRYNGFQFEHLDNGRRMTWREPFRALLMSVWRYALTVAEQAMETWKIGPRRLGLALWESCVSAPGCGRTQVGASGLQHGGKAYTTTGTAGR